MEKEMFHVSQKQKSLHKLCGAVCMLSDDYLISLLLFFLSMFAFTICHI